MTTRYKEEELLEGVMGTVHETGHALYEQNRNLDVSACAQQVMHAG